MQTRWLGTMGREVGCIGLGAMPLSLAGRPDEVTARRVIQAALDAGVTLIDTADAYCLDDREVGHNERLLATALRAWPGDRAGVVVATKGGVQRPRGDWTVDGSPGHLRAACDRSLAALQVEAIDLYQLHAPDPRVPFAETVGTLAELRRAGKVRHVGLSNVSVAQIEEARRIVPVVSVQNRCNIFERGDFASGVVRYCEQHHIALLPHSSVGGHHGHVRVRTDDTLRRVAGRRGVSPYQVALAWLLASSPAMIPIPGATRAESIQSSAAAAALVLEPPEIQELRAAFPL